MKNDTKLRLRAIYGEAEVKLVVVEMLFCLQSHGGRQ